MLGSTLSWLLQGSSPLLHPTTTFAAWRVAFLVALEVTTDGVCASDSWSLY